MLRMYGIANCDTCRKARKWFERQSAAVEFHDLRSDGLTRTMLGRWAGKVDWNALLNKRSTTWRRLPATDREGLDRERALALMLEHPTLVKRPVLEFDGGVEIGFSAERYRQLLS